VSNGIRADDESWKPSSVAVCERAATVRARADAAHRTSAVDRVEMDILLSLQDLNKMAGLASHLQMDEPS
jgi:hypothetical protein